MPELVSALTPTHTPAARWRDPADIEPPDAGEMQFRDLWSDKDKGFRFADLLDIVNPLQHLPVIGSVYRAITGDEISFGARLVGGALFGGPLGVMGAAALAASEQATGAEPARHLIAAVKELFGGGSDDTQLADTPARETPDPETLADIAPAAGPATEASPELPALAPAAATPVLSPASPATSTIVPAAAAITARPGQNREFPAFPPMRTPPARGVPPTLRPGLGPLRGEPTLPLAPGRSTAAPAASGTPHSDAKPMDAESRRIAAAVEDARRAQAALLLASLQGGVALPNAGTATEADGDDARAKDRAAADPFLRHPQIPPQGASSAWVNKAMERALERYQQTQQLQRGATPANRSVPAPVAPAAAQ